MSSRIELHACASYARSGYYIFGGLLLLCLVAPRHVACACTSVFTLYVAASRTRCISCPGGRSFPWSCHAFCASQSFAVEIELQQLNGPKRLGCSSVSPSCVHQPWSAQSDGDRASQNERFPARTYASTASSIRLEKRCGTTRVW